jgi:hypothetical protein
VANAADGSLLDVKKAPGYDIGSEVSDLDELDRELERRGHRFVRYADDCNIYVRSEKAGLERFVTLRTLRARRRWVTGTGPFAARRVADWKHPVRSMTDACSTRRQMDLERPGPPTSNARSSASLVLGGQVDASPGLSRHALIRPRP